MVEKVCGLSCFGKTHGPNFHVGLSGPSGYNFSQHSPTTRPSVERTSDKASLLSDRTELSPAEARVEGIVGGSVGVFELSQSARARTHTKPKSDVLRLMVSHGCPVGPLGAQVKILVHYAL